MGKQEANIYEIAREAGVSIATVSRVINHSNAVSEKSYRRVMDAVRKFNYVPNSTARSLSTSTSTSIGVVIPDINNPFFSLLLEGITRVADERGREPVALFARRRGLIAVCHALPAADALALGQGADHNGL